MKNIKIYQAYFVIVIIFLIIGQASLVQAQNCAQPAPNMVSWWRAEGNAQDARGSHNGTLQNGAFYANGKVGQAFSFDGVDDAISLGNQSGLQPSSITIEAWIWIGDIPEESIQNVFAKWGFDATVDSYLLGVYRSGGVIKVFGAIGDGTTGDPGLSGGDMSINIWNHIAMTYNAADGTHKLYQNGVEVASRIRLNGVFHTASNVYFGREDSTVQRFFNGSVDELAVYSRSLSASEIQAIVNAGSAGKCTTSSGAQATGRLSQKQKLLATPTVGSSGFGYSVAVDGNTMVVGANGFDTTPTTGINIGKAYVFVRNNGTWTQQAELQANDGAAGDEFGYSVSISGDTIIVGSLRGNAPALNSGAAYVFVRSGTTWTQQQKLTASDGAADDEFGNAVTISGDTIAVGAHSADQPNGGGHAGAVYIFNRSGTVWTQAQKLIPTGTVLFGDFLGESVAISGDTLVAGASGDDEPASDAGTVYVYTRSGGTWTGQQKLTRIDGTTGDALGSSLAIDGNTIVASALGDTPIVSQPNRGSVFVFVNSGAGWNQQQQLTASDAAASDYFGWSVAVQNDTIIIGARHDDTTSGADAGSAYIFTRSSGATWTEKQKLAAGDASAGDRFGTSVSLDNDGTLVVGAPEKNLPAGQGNGAGAVYVFAPAKYTPFDYDGDGKSDISIFRPSNGQWWIQRSQDNATVAYQFGTSTDKAVPADYDGDGKTDAAFWRPSTGEWFVLRSSNNTFFSAPFGISTDIPAPGDFDGDGFADFAVYRQSQGTWFINKSTGGVQITPFGTSQDIPVVADYDGDSKADIAIFRPNGGSGGGEWWMLRSTSGLFATPFGAATDKPVPADYTGDGKTDIAFFRPSSGTWFVLRSEDLSFYAAPFGTAGDIPSAADFDGDGRADITVFRPSGATWFINRSTAGILIQAFGANGDLPTQASFVP